MPDSHPLQSVDPSFASASLLLAATLHPLDLAIAAWLHAKAARLGHDSLATTGRYLAALFGLDQ